MDFDRQKSAGEQKEEEEEDKKSEDDDLTIKRQVTVKKLTVDNKNGSISSLVGCPSENADKQGSMDQSESQAAKGH